MGLAFTVGNPSDVFEAPFADRVHSTLLGHFGDAVILDSDEAPFYSEEIGWSGWQSLQERAAEAVTAERVPHLLSLEAWCGCYVPADVQPGRIEFDGESTALAVGSLGRLLSELEAVGAALGLPTDDLGLRELAGRYQDDDLVDEDMEIQTYAQLLRSAHAAQRRRPTLWVVK
jgi:hypothetical protein